MPVGLNITTRLNGLNRIRDKLKRRVRAYGKRLERGLKRSGAMLIRESLREVPIDTGLLRSTWYVRQEKELARTEVFIGYTAAYAMYVHETVGNAHGSRFNLKYAHLIATRATHRRRPHEKAKFLIDPFNNNRERMIKIIRDSLKEHYDTII